MRQCASRRLCGSDTDERHNTVCCLEISARCFLPFELGATLAETVDSLGLRPVDDAGEIARAVEEVMAANPKAVADARASPAAVNHVMGLVKRRCGGRADPATARSLIEERLRSHDMG
ncbi:MAG: hypothetical protein EB824_03730 [Thaumarchaeota archaeon S15]|nr:MAG: hypothetical protein EB824_03730 [Thaumarchaeota archaeon S15]